MQELRRECQARDATAPGCKAIGSGPLHPSLDGIPRTADILLPCLRSPLRVWLLELAEDLGPNPTGAASLLCAPLMMSRQMFELCAWLLPLSRFRGYRTESRPRSCSLACGAGARQSSARSGVPSLCETRPHLVIKGFC